MSLLMLENWGFKSKNLLKSEISFYTYKSKHYLGHKVKWNELIKTKLSRVDQTQTLSRAIYRKHFGKIWLDIFQHLGWTFISRPQTTGCVIMLLQKAYIIIHYYSWAPACNNCLVMWPIAGCYTGHYYLQTRLLTEHKNHQSWSCE